MMTTFALASSYIKKHFVVKSAIICQFHGDITGNSETSFLTYFSAFVTLFFLTEYAAPLLTAILVLSIKSAEYTPVLIGIPIFVIAECCAVKQKLWTYEGQPKYLVPGYLPSLWGIAISLITDITDTTRNESSEKCSIAV